MLVDSSSPKSNQSHKFSASLPASFFTQKTKTSAGFITFNVIGLKDRNSFGEKSFQLDPSAESGALNPADVPPQVM